MDVACAATDRHVPTWQEAALPPRLYHVAWLARGAVLAPERCPAFLHHPSLKKRLPDRYNRTPATQHVRAHPTGTALLAPADADAAADVLCCVCVRFNF